MAELSREDRIKAFIAGYTHGIEHNAPRTAAELAEMKDLLGVGEKKPWLVWAADVGSKRSWE
jgi:hypothetical protein